MVTSNKGSSMRLSTTFALLLSLATLWGCAARPFAGTMAPRVDLEGYATLGVVEFASNGNSGINARTTREFGSHIQSAQPRARLVDLGSREALLAAVGSEQLDAKALRKIGQKYGVDAIFVGELNYSEPKTDAAVGDGASQSGELRADIAYTLLETRSGDSVWSNSASAQRALGRMKALASHDSGGTVRTAANLREEMVPGLVYRLTADFRPQAVR